MKIKLISFLLFSWLVLPLCAQQVEMVLPKANAENSYVNTKRSSIQSVAPAAYFDPKTLVGKTIGILPLLIWGEHTAMNSQRVKKTASNGSKPLISWMIQKQIQSNQAIKYCPIHLI